MQSSKEGEIGSNGANGLSSGHSSDTILLEGCNEEEQQQAPNQAPHVGCLQMPGLFQWAQQDPVFGFIQPATTSIGSRGASGEFHQLEVMKQATVLLDLYEHFMRDREARLGGQCVPWPIDRSNKEFQRAAYWVAQRIKVFGQQAESGRFKILGGMQDHVDAPARWIWPGEV